MSHRPGFTPVNPQTLTDFFDQVTTVIGDENISRTAEHGALPDPKGLDTYNDPFSNAPNLRASGAVRPSSVAEIQQILKLANTHKVPLWPVSRGRNLGYDFTPRREPH